VSTLALQDRRFVLPSERTMRVLGVLGLLLLEVVLGLMSVQFAPPGSTVAAYWPGSGVSLIALAVSLPRYRPLTVGGIYVASVLANVLGGRSMDLSLAYGLVNASEAALAIWILTQDGRLRPRLETLEDFFRLVIAALAGSTLAGLVAGAAVSLLENGDPWITGRAVLASHSAAMLLIAPLGMAMPSVRRLAPMGEVVTQWVLLALTIMVVFRPGQLLPLGFLPYPMLIWGAMRLTLREVSWQLVASAGFISFLTTLGQGPFVNAAVNQGYPPEVIGTLLQSSLLAAAVVTLPLALIHTQSLVTFDDLAASHDMVSNILGSTTGTAILGTTLDGRIEFFNVGAERLTGYAAKEVVGASTITVAQTEDGLPLLGIGVGEEPDMEALDGLVDPMLDASGGTFTMDWQFRRRDGDLRTISVAISRRLDGEGTPVGYLGVADDVTERRQQEESTAQALEAEKQLVDRLAQVDQAKNDFLSTVSHELRTPITSIIGYSQLLLSDDSRQIPTMHQQIIGRIERNGRRLMGLIEDMLTMSQIEVGTMRFHRVPLDVREPIQQAVESVTTALPLHQIELVQEIPEEAVKVLGDLDKLERAFANLLSNAVKFSHAGDAVVVRLEVRDGHALVSVRDSGVGISLEDQAHLFDRFFRGADATARAIQGAGLGLSIAHSIVQGHDGSIDIESVLGQGSTFTVHLPLLEG
jgi:signal transduction histidine kinase/integral membrane sensor domain MASE1